MKNPITPLAYFLIVLLCNPVIAQEKNISLDELWSGAFSPKRLESIRSMKDGNHYTVLEQNENTKSSTVVRYAYGDPNKKEIVINSSDVPFLENFTDYSFSKNETKLLLETQVDPIYRRSKQGVYWVYDLSSQKLIKVAEEKIQEPLLSPDATKVAYVFRRNLFIKFLDSGITRQITFDGDFQTLNGITDWVYEEEFGFVRAFDWQEDSDHIAYMRFDESDVPLFSMDIYGSETYPFPYMFRYPKAGEANAEIALYYYEISSGNRTRIQFSGDQPYYIPRMKFAGGSNSLLLQTTNRHQNHLILWRWDTETQSMNILLEERDDAYVSVHDDLTFLPDTSFLWTSERDGFKHLYHYNSNGKLIRQLTQGPWEVTDVYTYNPKKKEVYFQSVEGSSTERGIFAVSLSGKTKRVLQPTKGTNGATFSKDGSFYIHSYSDETTPPVYTLYETNKNKPLRELLENNDLKEKLAEFDLPDKEFSTLELNGESLNMWMIKPRDFDPTKKYPLLLFQYSGPGSQQVANRWGDERLLWHKGLTQSGYIIACIDGRGTGFKGAAFKKSTYLNLVKYESIDQIKAAKALGELPYIEASRIGIWGWSFGGHMAAHCLLTGNDVFSMAIAVAPVTNWRFYDTIYTERFMRTPQENPQGYDLNSPLNYADQLKGNFLIIHGSGDDNVHVQNTMRMVEALIQENKQFEWMIYPDKNHGIYGGNTRKHLYTKMTTFIKENL
jgi:dipeptidyl-peptidase-4